MNGIILAAGRGSRMGDCTAKAPKCLTELAGKPLLLWQIAAMQAVGIKDILVLRGYLAESLVPEKLGLASAAFYTIDNPDWASTNMLSTLLCAYEWGRSNDCLISYSDIVYSAAHLEKLNASPWDISITYDTLWRELWTLRFDDPLQDAETFTHASGKLLSIGDKPHSYDEINGQYMGLIKLTPAGWETIKKQCDGLGAEVNRTDMTSFLRGLLKKGVTIGAVPVEGKWCEVDSESDLVKYQQKLNVRSWAHDWRKS